MKTFNRFLEERKVERRLEPLAKFVAEQQIDLEEYFYNYFLENHPEIIQDGTWNRLAEGLWDDISQSNIGQGFATALKGFPAGYNTNVAGNWNKALQYLKSVETIANKWAGDPETGESANKLKTAIGAIEGEMNKIAPDIQTIDQKMRARAVATGGNAGTGWKDNNAGFGPDTGQQQAGQQQAGQQQQQQQSWHGLTDEQIGPIAGQVGQKMTQLGIQGQGDEQQWNKTNWDVAAYMLKNNIDLNQVASPEDMQKMIQNAQAAAQGQSAGKPAQQQQQNQNQWGSTAGAMSPGTAHTPRS